MYKKVKKTMLSQTKNCPGGGFGCTVRAVDDTLLVVYPIRIISDKMSMGKIFIRSSGMDMGKKKISLNY
jgi:hypothetical protein